MTTTQLIDTAKIDDRGRLRTVRPDIAAAMAELMESAGQLQPIRVTETPEGYQLRFGARRLAGVNLLGWPQISAIVVQAADEDSETDLAIQSIVENFGQFGMTVLERALRLAEWKDLHEVRHPTTKRGGDRRKTTAYEQTAEFAVSFSEQAALALDISERSVRLAIQIARNIAVEHHERLRHHSVADRQQELLLLADQTHPRQRAIVDLLTVEPVQATSVTDAIAVLDMAPGRREVPIYEKLQQRFAVLKANEQERFLDLNAEVIERWMAKRLAAQAQKAAA